LKAVVKPVMEEDDEDEEELERIRLDKLKAMIQSRQNTSTTQEAAPPLIVTDSTFNDIIKKGSLVVIDCWASWCAPCRMLEPIIEELTKDYIGKIIFGKLNVDENHDVPTKYQILSIPTIMVFKNGQLVDRMTGVMPRKILEPRLTQHL